MQAQQQLKIIAYLKAHCGWSKGIRAVLEKYALPYEYRDIISNEKFYFEMVQKSNQHLSPCVEVNGKMLADISGEELEHYLLQQKLITKSNAATTAPINAACQDH